MKQIKQTNFKTSAFPSSDLPLTRREIQVVMLLAKGSTDKQVASRLNISVHTVRTHHKNILHKTGQHNTGALLVYALRNELVAPAMIFSSPNRVR